MHPNDELIPLLKKLRLSGVLQSLDLRVRQAADDNLAHSEFLLRLFTDELERRDGKQLQLRLGKANFEHHKALEDFDFSFNPKIPKAKILELATCAFVSRRENVAIVGQAGLGKSHLAQALGHRACLAGYCVLYTGAKDMFTSLRAARADDSYERKLLKFTAPELLIIDDLGLLPLRAEEPIDLYEVIRHRYEHVATIITSNRDLEEWYPLFRDDLLASAALDRFLHHCSVLTCLGRSFRNPKARLAAAVDPTTQETSQE